MPGNGSAVSGHSYAAVKKRNLLHNPALAWLAGALFNVYAQLVLLTSSIRIWEDPGTEVLLWERRVPVIYALWHCHLVFMPLLRIHSRRPLAVLLSSHRDARIAGVAARLRRVDLVEGSSTRGGVTAYRRLLRLLRGGQSVCITPDGPRGPAGRVKKGVVHLAQSSGCAVVPVGLALSRRRRLRSWDRCVVPLPFGRVVLTLGAPLYVGEPVDDSLLPPQTERLAEALEAASRQAALLLARGRR
jgi:lysophospholipid acyltransferase (LPLAT)-like uncharacterized protein